MKVLVDVSEDFYLWIKTCGLMPCITQGKVISDNATNLDALMTVFPGVTLDKIMCVDINWAKEPYNKEVEEC